MARSVASLPILLIVLAIASAAPLAHAAAPVSSHAMIHTCCTPDAMAERLFAESKAMGARFIRVDVELNAIFEAGGHSPANPDWRRLDAIAALSRRYDLPVLGILLHSPAWLSSCPEAGAEAVRCAPRDPAAFGRLAGQVAAHARATIRHWEIVNEPDGAWAFRGTPADYARVLRASHDEIKSRVPEARVAMGGVMSPHDPAWVERVFATPGADAARAFDIANLHLRGSASAVTRQLHGWRDLLGRYGFNGPLWVTEHGYPGDPAYQSDPAFRGGEPAQAAYLTESVMALAEAGAGEVFVTLRDNLDGMFASEGVVEIASGPDYAARRKPAFAAVRRLVDDWEGLTAARTELQWARALERIERRGAEAAHRAAAAQRPRVDEARRELQKLAARVRRARRPAVRERLTPRLERARRRVSKRRTGLAWKLVLAALHEDRAAQLAGRAREVEAFLAGV
jgi:hypothetical protein